MRGFSFPLYHEKKTFIVLGGRKISTDKGWGIFFCFSKENPPHTLERVNQLIKKKRPLARSLSETGRVRVAGRSAPAQRVHPRSLLPPAPRNSTNRLASGNSHPEAQWTMGPKPHATSPHVFWGAKQQMNQHLIHLVLAVRAIRRWRCSLAGRQGRGYDTLGVWQGWRPRLTCACCTFHSHEHTAPLTPARTALC